MVVVTVELKGYLPRTRSGQGTSSRVESSQAYVAMSRVAESPSRTRLSSITTSGIAFAVEACATPRWGDIYIYIQRCGSSNKETNRVP
jgi:hypothetical protein